MLDNFSSYIFYQLFASKALCTVCNAKALTKTTLIIQRQKGDFSRYVSEMVELSDSITLSHAGVVIV